MSIRVRNQKNLVKLKNALTLCAIVSVGSLLATPQAHAVEFQTIVSRGAEQAASGIANAISGSIIVENTTKFPLVYIPLPYSSSTARFVIDGQRFVLKPGETQKIQFKGAILSAGKWQIDLPFAVYKIDSKIELEKQSIDLYYFVTKGTNGGLSYRVSNYEELFIKMGARNLPGQGRVFEGRQDLGQIKKGDDFRNNKQPEMKLWPTKPDRESSRKIPTESGQIRGIFDSPLEFLNEDFYADESLQQIPLSPLGLINASGTFSWNGTDSALHPAWGWRVRAWVGAGGNWSKVAEDWIQWNGNWSLSFNQPAGSQVQFQYVADNRYFKPQSNDGDTYRWVGPVRATLAATHNEGGWFADTNNGNARGLGELYRDAYTLWSNLYWQGQINPLRSSPINVIFPNLTYKCGGTSVWSCANTSGNIWLIPSHGINGQTMIHELGHQLNYEFWDNSLPSGTGGSHSLDQCYTAGLALTEGFANFMVGWTKTNRDNNANMVRNLEDPGVISACTTKDLNESWVGATFWDMHDKVTDGKDSLYFIHRGAVPSLFLNAGMKQKMSDFRDTYRSAANPEHRSIIDNIFTQNHTN